MRLATVLSLLLVGCGPGTDPMIGSFPFTVTGTDTNTAPNTTAYTVTGTGTVAITSTASMSGYLVTLAHFNTNACTLEATATEKATGPDVTIKGGQTCTFASGSGTVTATITSGKAVVKLGDTRAADALTLDVAYSYSGTTALFNQPIAGSGKRTYTGTRR